MSSNYNWRELSKTNPRELVLSGDKISKQIEEELGLNELIFAMNSLNFVEITKTNSLTQISAKISQLINLTNLVLHSNKLTTLPSEIGLLSKLKFLDLSRNSIDSLPDSLSQLTTLQSLNLEHNQLKELPDLSSLNNLLVIKLSGNQLTKFPSSLSDNGLLIHLSEIHANNNQIDDIPNTINKLVALKVLDLSFNSIQVIPGQLGDCHKLKDINLKNNKIKDRRLQKLIDQCHAKQILDYIRSHCPRTHKSNNESNDKTSEPNEEQNTAKLSSRESSQDRKAKQKDARRRRRSSSRSHSESDPQLDCITILPVKEDDWFKAVASPVILELRKIVVCIVRGVDLAQEGILKRFITLQTGLHTGICGHRQHATIATHDLSKISGKQIFFDIKPPTRIKFVPLGRQKDVTAQELYKTLNEEAEAYRKEKKRQSYSGIHKYLYLLKGKQRFPCVLDENQKVISLPPLINSETTKITEETKDMLLEVTGESVPTCRKVMDALLHSMLKLGLNSVSDTNETNAEPNDSNKPFIPRLKTLTVEPVKVVDNEGKLYVQYPSKIDLYFEDIEVKRQKE